MIRDGIDTRPLTICEKACQQCARTCRLADIDAELRYAGFFPIADAPIVNGGWIEGITTHGKHVLARYDARKGDYLDRWTNGRGNVEYRLTHWRATKRPIPTLRRIEETD